MSDQHQIPIIDEETQTEEQKEEKTRLKAAFTDLENKQPDFLDEAGKSIIERIATFLAILFAVIALGGNFPPKYLVGNMWAKIMVLAILACYLVAMGLGMLAIHPRTYGKYRYNMTRMSKEWERLVTYKKQLVQWAGILFGLGTIALAGLIVAIIWPL